MLRWLFPVPRLSPCLLPVMLVSTAGAQVLDDQAAHIRFSGYLKTLWLDTQTVFGREQNATLGINRWRLTGRSSLGSARLEWSYDLEWLMGNYLASEQAQLHEAHTPERYWQLQKVWHRSDSEQGRHSLYRAHLKVPLGPLDVRVGRQQLNWARTFLWSSFDRFNPYNPLQLEPDERQGVDALQLTWTLKEPNSLEAVAVGADDANAQAFGIRYRTHAGKTDIDALVADFGLTRAVGVAAAGQWGDAGWRLEATRNRRQRNTPDVKAYDFNDLVLGIDYTFTTQTTLLVEALYRGDGADRSQSYDWNALLAGRRTTLARRYLGAVIRQDLEPIAGLDLTLLHNLDDSSSAVIPTLRYSPGRYEDLQFRVGIQYFEGASDSEFGRLHTLAFGEMQWFY